MWQSCNSDLGVQDPKAWACRPKKEVGDNIQSDSLEPAWDGGQGPSLLWDLCFQSIKPRGLDWTGQSAFPGMQTGEGRLHAPLPPPFPP